MGMTTVGELNKQREQDTKGNLFGADKANNPFAEIPKFVPAAPIEKEIAAPEAPKENVSFGDAFGAGLTIYNTLPSIGYGWEKSQLEDQADYDFGKVDLKGYDEYADKFVSARSNKEVDLIKSKIDEERYARETLDKAGTTGVVASLAAGVLDPINFVPFLGAASKIKAGTTAARAGLILGAEGATSVAAQEGILHVNQETRTLDESLLNITAGALLSGVLGGALKGLGRDLVEQETRHVADTIAEPHPNTVAAETTSAQLSKPVYRWDGQGWVSVEPLGPMTAAGANAAASVPTSSGVQLIHPYVPGQLPTSHTNMADEALVKEQAVKIGSITNFLRGDSLRLAVSPSLWSRKIGQLVSDDNLLRVKNTKGIANDASVELKAKMRETELSNTLDEIKQRWVDYSRRVPKDQRTYGTYDDFKSAVARAAHAGDDLSTLGKQTQEVGAAAVSTRKYLNAVLRDGESVGHFPVGMTPKGAVSYMTRSYNHTKIANQYGDFTKDLANEFRTSTQMQVAPDGRTWEAVAEGVRERILTLDKDVDSILTPALSNTLKERNVTINFSDKFIADWLDTDIERQLVNYYKRTVPKIELQRMYNTLGVKDGHGLADIIRTEYNQLKAGKSDAAITKLEKEMQNDIASVVRLINRLTGKVDRGVSDTTAKVARNLKEVNRLASLGGVVISSMTDYTRLIAIKGLAPVIGEVDTLFKTFSNTLQNIPKTELRSIAAPLEYDLQTRVSMMSDMTDDLISPGAFSKGLEKTGHLFNKMTLMPLHNTGVKVVAAAVTRSKILKAGDKLLNGTRVGQKTMQDMAKLGIDEPMAKEIASQFKAHSTADDMNLDAWTNQNAATALSAALRKNADNIIVTPGAGTLPPFMDNAVGSLMMQFKSFVFSYHNQALLAGMQQADAAFLTSIVGSIAMGGLLVQTKSILYGSPEPKDFNTLLRDSIDTSGVGGLVWEGNNMLTPVQNKIFGTNATNYVFGTKGYTQRLSDLNGFQITGGPAIGMAKNGFDALISSVSPNGMSDANVHAVRKMIPFQNIFYLRRLFDEFENGTKRMMGKHGKEQPGFNGDNIGQGDYGNVNEFFESKQ